MTDKYEDNPYPKTGTPFFNAKGYPHDAPQTKPKDYVGKQEMG